MKRIKLAAMVTLYNPSEDNISTIDNYIDAVDKLYIFDNSNNVDNSNLLPKNKKIIYLTEKKNKGIAYSMNICAKKAIKDGYKYLLTLDQDSKMTSNIINEMIRFLENTKEKNIGLISPYQDIDSKDEISDIEYENQIEMMTSGNIINLDAYEKIGGFKDWLFIDCVDTDYCMNLHKHGYKVFRLNKVIMKHNLGNLEVHHLFGKDYPCYNHNPIRRYYIVRNNLYINKMYHDLFPEYCEHLIKVQKGQVKRILAFEKNKFKKLRMMYRGYRDYKKGIKGQISSSNK